MTSRKLPGSRFRELFPFLELKTFEQKFAKNTKERVTAEAGGDRVYGIKDRLGGVFAAQALAAFAAFCSKDFFLNPDY